MPSFRDLEFLERNAALIAAVGADPAAGAEVVQQVPVGQAWELLAVRFVLVTSAAVANRRVNLCFDDGGAPILFCKIGAPTAQVASQNIGYTFTVGAPFTQPSDMVCPIPLLRLPAGWRWRTITDSIDAGDNFSAPSFCYRRIGG
jgi:hypothetical protein